MITVEGDHSTNNFRERTVLLISLEGTHSTEKMIANDYFSSYY